MAAPRTPLPPAGLRAAAVAALAVSGLLLAGCPKTGDVAPKAAVPPAAAAPTTPATALAPHAPADAGIAWRHASTDAQVDAAFAQAKAEGKPVFMYWGAAWCPPCNQVKATLFNRHDFIERSRGFVPVYVDGDSPGAQKVGARFKVGGYPTMVLFNPRGTEVTRLPGEVDAARYSQVLTLGLNAERPVKTLLAQALGAVPAGAATAPLAPNDWRLLAFYSWDTDQQQLVPKEGVPALLGRLADACPATLPEAATRLRLKALAASPGAAAEPDAALRSQLMALLADAVAARTQLDVLSNHAADIARAMSRSGTPERTALLATFDAALARFATDTTLSRADRITALQARVDLARIELPKADPASSAPAPQPTLRAALLADVREQTARADREITDGYERQAVVTTAAYVLQQAGLDAESDAMLQANLAKSHSPYYLMSDLAHNARQRGDAAGALRWYEAAFDKSQGPATRLQWGHSYLAALVDLAPGDAARIERTASGLLTEAAALPDAFHQRSGRSLQRIGAKLVGWNARGAHAPAMKRLQTQLDGVCAGMDAADPTRAACTGLFKPAARTSQGASA